MLKRSNKTEPFDPILFLFRTMNVLSSNQLMAIRSGGGTSKGPSGHIEFFIGWNRWLTFSTSVWKSPYLAGATFNNREENKDTKVEVINTTTVRFTVCGSQDELILSY